MSPLRYHSLIYAQLLARYMQEKHQQQQQHQSSTTKEDSCDSERTVALVAETRYSQLMATLGQMGPVIEIIRDVYTNDLNRAEVAHVLAEIYDLV